MGWLKELYAKHITILRENITDRTKLLSLLWAEKLISDTEKDSIDNKFVHNTSNNQNDQMWKILIRKETLFDEQKLKDILTEAENYQIVQAIWGKKNKNEKINKINLGKAVRPGPSLENAEPMVVTDLGLARSSDTGFLLENHDSFSHDFSHLIYDLNQSYQSYKPKISSEAERKGIVLIINIVNFPKYPPELKLDRTGASNDTEKLRNILKKKYYTVFEYDNALDQSLQLDYDHLMTIFDDFIDKIEKGFINEYGNENGDWKSCIVSIMSHGTRGDHFYSSDGVKIPVDQMVKKFNNQKCQQKLLGKPKIFLFDFCRGSAKGQVLYSQRRVEDEKLAPNLPGQIEIDDPIPRWSDVLISFASMENQVSWKAYKLKGYTDGNIFTQTFCQVLEKQPSLEITKILNLVSAALLQKKIIKNDKTTNFEETQYMQVSMYKNIGFTREFYF